MPIQRDLIRHQPWNGEISAKNARALAISSFQRTLEESVTTVTPLEKDRSLSPECCPDQNIRSKNIRKRTAGSTIQCELHLPDESRYHQVITLRKCPWCGTKPIVLKHKNFCQVVHMAGINCDFGSGLPPLPMDGAKRAWNLAVKLCR